MGVSVCRKCIVDSDAFFAVYSFFLAVTILNRIDGKISDEFDVPHKQFYSLKSHIFCFECEKYIHYCFVYTNINIFFCQHPFVWFNDG